MERNDEEGFTLAGLLVTIAIVLVVMVVVLPHFEHVQLMADDAEAISSLHTLNQMEAQYRAKYPDHGFACTLAALGGDAKQGVPSPEAAHLITPNLAHGKNGGYRFTLFGCVPGPQNSYRITAVPISLGKTGRRTFCTDNSERVTVDPSGGDQCTQPLR